MSKTNVYAHFIDKQGKRLSSNNGKIIQDASLKKSSTVTQQSCYTNMHS